MDKPGTEVYFVVRCANGEKARLTGRVVEASADSVIVASQVSSLPNTVVCLETWKKVAAAELVSSDLEKLQDVPLDLSQDLPRKKTSKVGLQEDFSRLRKVLAAQESDESGESSDELPEFGARLRSPTSRTEASWHGQFLKSRPEGCSVCS